MGRTVWFDNKNDLKVTGILKDIPANSSLQFNFLAPFNYFEQTASWVKEQRAGSFAENSYQIFVKLKSGISYAQVSDKIKDITKTEKDNSKAMGSDVIMQPIILSAAMAIVITLITISFEAIKATIANPVKSLRTE